MFERFTEPARQALTLAEDEARTLRHSHTGTEHILIGLLRAREGLAARVLESLDVSLEQARAHVLRIHEFGEEAASGQIPLTPRAERVLKLASSEARAFGHERIGTEHVLLALWRENQGVAAAVLLNLGADDDLIPDQVRRMLSGHDGDDHPSRERGSKGEHAATSEEQVEGQPQEASETGAARSLPRDTSRAGGADPAAILLDPPPELLGVKVKELLIDALRPGRGLEASRARSKVHSALSKARIAPSRTLGGLSDRQRQALVDELRLQPP